LRDLIGCLNAPAGKLGFKIRGNCILFYSLLAGGYWVFFRPSEPPACRLIILRLNGFMNKYKLAYLKDSNAAEHSVDSDMFQSSDSSTCALQDLTLTFIS